MPQMLDDMMLTSEASQRLNVSVRMILLYISSGRLPAQRATPADVEALYREGRLRSRPRRTPWVIRRNDVEQIARERGA